MGMLTRDAAPPPPSKAELEKAEAQTASDIKWTAAAAAVLYLCKLLRKQLTYDAVA